MLQSLTVSRFMQGDAYWAMCMAINVYLTFYHKYDGRMLRRMEPIYWAGCLGVPLIPGLAFIWVSTKSQGRVYGNALLWCWIKTEWDVWRIASFYGPVWYAATRCVSDKLIRSVLTFPSGSLSSSPSRFTSVQDVRSTRSVNAC
jgi:Slime mold cyclic AMP receptor.